MADHPHASGGSHPQSSGVQHPQSSGVQHPQSSGGSHPHVLAHDHADNVAVVVVEGLTAGTRARGVVTHDDSAFEVEVRDDVPIGHKVALTDLGEGDTAVKYGEDIGRIVAPVARGAHVHTHNLRTKRW